MATRAFGRFFDDPDDLFNWLNQLVYGTAVMNAVNQAGVIAALLEGPANVEELAARCDLPEDKLGRLADYLLANEMIERGVDGRLQANARTGMMHETASYLAHAVTSCMAGSRLLQGLREGTSPFELFFGEPVFDYFAHHQQEAETFSKFMGFMTRRAERFIFSHHQFQPFGTVADIGGSMGEMLQAMLTHYPGTRGILLELPHVADMARPQIADSPMAERIDIVGGDFFKAVPTADLYVLKQILHDWDDDACVAILRNVRAAMNPGGRLAVIEHVLSEVPSPSESQGADIAMMVWATGRERRQAEFEALFAASGFVLARVTNNPGGHCVIEAVPV